MNNFLSHEIEKLERMVGKNIDMWSIPDWECVSECVLSLDFIRKHKDKVNWKIISKDHFLLSKSFIREFKDKLDLQCLLRRKYITQEFIDNLDRKISRFELMEIE